MQRSLPHQRASSNLRRFTLRCGKSAKRGSHISWSKSSARRTVTRATHLPADQQKAFGWHLPLFFFFSSLLLASSELAPSNTWLAGYSSTATSRVLYWAPCSAVASKDCTEPSLWSSLCSRLLYSGTSHTNQEWRWQKGRVEDCRASPRAALK